MNARDRSHPAPPVRWLIFFMLWGLVQTASGLDAFEVRKERVDEAVDRGLRFLASHQAANGAFPGLYGRSTAVVSLGGMAFLAKGYMPGEAPYGDVINRCIDYVLGANHANGLLDRGDAAHGIMYCHNISTLFLSEVSGMVDPVRQEKIDLALPRALALILNAQRVPKAPQHAGGWRYQPTSRDSDMSCSGWALMALRSARLNGGNVPDDAIARAVHYILGRHNGHGGFGYQDTRTVRPTLSGCALLCLELTGHHGQDVTLKAGHYLVNSMTALRREPQVFYGMYYVSQGLFQLGGTHWQKFCGWMYDTWIPLQNDSGAWSAPKNGEGYATAMMVLAFTVPYRQLPIYQRDETVDEQ